MIETPWNYINYAARNPEGILPEPYKHHLVEFLKKPEDDATNPADVFSTFYYAAQNQPRLKIAFYTAVRKGFDLLKKYGADGQSIRWNRLMPAMINQAMRNDDTPLQKHLITIVEDTVPHLLIQHATNPDFEIASDILLSAGQSDLLRPHVQKSDVHQVVKWRIKTHKDDMIRAAQHLADLQLSPPFAEEIIELENKKGLHIRTITNSHTNGGLLVVAFNRNSESLSFYRLTNHGQKQEISDEDAVMHFGESINIILENERDESPHDWVQQIAREAHFNM